MPASVIGRDCGCETGAAAFLLRDFPTTLETGIQIGRKYVQLYVCLSPLPHKGHVIWVDFFGHENLLYTAKGTSFDKDPSYSKIQILFCIFVLITDDHPPQFQVNLRRRPLLRSSLLPIPIVPRTANAQARSKYTDHC